jgi:hypothetical protein
VVRESLCVHKNEGNGTMTLSAVLMVAGTLLSGLSTTRVFVGVATDMNQGKRLYAEEHEALYENGKPVRLTTTYRNDLKSVIATRVVDFSRHAFTPDFRLENLRTGYLEGAENVDGGIRLYVRRAANEPTEEKLLSVSQPTVVDAGFNSFVQTYWDSLMAGKKLYFNFAVPSRLESYGFRLYKESETSVNGKRAVIVKCDIDNFFLRFLVKPIILKYDVESTRLLTYEGISNISDDKGDNYLVRIAFDPLGP